MSHFIFVYFKYILELKKVIVTAKYNYLDFILSNYCSTVLITGVSPNSVGLATALAIASQKPSLMILASRSHGNLSSAIDTIKDAFPSIEIRSLLVDLASMESVRAAANEVLAYDEKSIDILINNAGLMDLRSVRTVTKDGFEQHMAINHLGHFLFTNLIMPKLRAAAAATGEARIVVVASSSTMISPVRFSDINVEKASMDVPKVEQPNLGILEYLQIPAEKPYIAWVAYGQSKTASILATVKWAEMLKSHGISILCLHPGGKLDDFIPWVTTEALLMICSNKIKFAEDHYGSRLGIGGPNVLEDHSSGSGYDLSCCI